MTAVQQQIINAAVANGIDPGIALGVAQVESNFNQAAISSAGAIGVFQLIPATAASLGVDPTDQTSNITGGISYLAQMLNLFGSWGPALAAYNWGPGNVANSGGVYPSSVANYVSQVISVATTYDAQLGYAAPSVTGGGSLLAELLPSSTMGWIAWGVGGFVFLYLLMD